MKQQQSLITLGLSALSLILCLWVIFSNSHNKSLQRDYKEKLAAGQREKSPYIQQGQMTQQVGTAIIKDMGEVALKNDKMKDLLKKQGIEVRANPTPAPATDSESKPAAPAKTSP